MGFATVHRILAEVGRDFVIKGLQFTVPDTPANLGTFGKHYIDRAYY